MKRYVQTYLNQWVLSVQRKPLVIRGARQVGKTWIVRKLAEEHNLDLIEFNFERSKEEVSLFESNNPKEILTNIEASRNRVITREKSLLFLDEIQAVPHLFAKLRWFYEEMPELAVIAAGSLLEFLLEDHDFSMPVGRIEYCYLEPLSFEEFLRAKEQEKLLEFIQKIEITQTIPESIHTKLLNTFKEYSLVGGMPEAVFSWVQKQSFPEVHKIQQNIIATYRDDFHKYAQKIDVTHLHDILNAVPQCLGEKFVFSRVTTDVTSVSLKKALHLLTNAHVCHSVISSSANGIPLKAQIKEKFFKVIFLDVGLASAVLRLNLRNIELTDTHSFVNRGGLAEQLVGQLLRTIEAFYMEPELFYWIREEKSSSAEIDYLIQEGSEIIPIEVKSGSTGSLKSLHLFMHLKKLPRAVRINASLPSITPVSTKLYDGTLVSYQLLSIPFYLIEQLPRLLRK